MIGEVLKYFVAQELIPYDLYGSGNKASAHFSKDWWPLQYISRVVWINTGASPFGKRSFRQSASRFVGLCYRKRILTGAVIIH